MAVLRNPSSLRLAFWNANGVLPKRNELEAFINAQDLDVIAVSETHLNPCHSFKITNYNTYRADRNGKNGGTTIIVRNNIDHCELDPFTNLTEIEANVINITMANQEQLRICSVYSPPHNTNINEDIKTIFRTNHPTVAVGDYNAKHQAWNSRIINRRGRDLLTYANDKHLQIHGPDSPTYFSGFGHKPDVLDIAITHKVNMLSIHAVHDLTSDHIPVITEINAQPLKTPTPDVRKTNWDMFTNELDSLIDDLTCPSTPEEIDILVSKFTINIQKSLEISTTLAENRASNPLDLPRWLQNKIKTRNKARKIWQKFRTKNSHNRYKNLVYEIRSDLAEIKNQRWRHTLEQIDTDEEPMWRIAKFLRRKRQSYPLIEGESGPAYSNQQKAEAIAESLERQMSPIFDNNTDYVKTHMINKSVRKKMLAKHEIEIDFTTPKEVHNIISNVNIRRAPGPDGIPNAALRRLPQKAVITICNIANACLRLGYFPHAWKEANIVVFPKPGKNLKIPSNYRPISLLSNIGKAVEKIILTRLTKVSDRLCIIPASQHGFRKGYSTVHQLMRVVEYIQEGFNRKHDTGAVFLDVAKAFDRVWHKGLIHKMMVKGFPLYLIKTIASYLHDRRFQVNILGSFSSQKTMSAGVPQGSAISPLLFNIFISDLPSVATTMTAQYADDTAVLYRSYSPAVIRGRLQQQLDALNTWFIAWRLQINASKSRAVHFTWRRKGPIGELKMGGEVIQWLNQVQYLGLTLDCRLTWVPHINKKIAISRGTVNQLMPLLNRRSHLSIHNKIRLFKTIIRPQLLYAAPVWGYSSPSSIRRIQERQNAIIRIISGEPWFVRSDVINRELKIEPVIDIIKQLATKHHAKLIDHPDQSVRDTHIHYDENMPSKRKRPKSLLL